MPTLNNQPLHQIMWAHVSEATGEIVDLMRIRPHLSGPIGTTTVEVVVQEHSALNEAAEVLRLRAVSIAMREAIMRAWGSHSIHEAHEALRPIIVDERYDRDYVADPGPLVAAVEGVVKALDRLSKMPDCGCRPCTGQCRSSEALTIEIGERCDVALAALAACRAAIKGEVDRG